MKKLILGVVFCLASNIAFAANTDVQKKSWPAPIASQIVKDYGWNVDNKTFHNGVSPAKRAFRTLRNF